MDAQTDNNAAILAEAQKPLAQPNRVSTALLTSWMKIEGISVREAADLLGVSTSAIYGWQEAGKMPKTVSLAVEGLRRRRAQQKETILLVKAGEKTGVLLSILAAMGIEHKEI